MPFVRLLLLPVLALAATAQTTTLPAPQTPVPQTTAALPPATPTRADILRGAYGPARANNDLLHYHLHLRVDPSDKSIRGDNSVRFRMLADGSRIQLDLTDTLALDYVNEGNQPLKVTRDAGAVFVDFPAPLKAGSTHEIQVSYHGNPVAKGRFGGMSFESDPAGRPWVFTADEDDGCSIWFPCKDQWRDEPQDGVDLSIEVPDSLMDVSNGRLLSHEALHDGFTRWNWHVSYPINSYDIALNIGAYQHFADTYTSKDFAPLTLDYYALPEDLEAAKRQFPQARGMLDAFEHYFGEYPFARDGYKLVQVPYAGMEHQSAVAYGNKFRNGYYISPDWAGVGLSSRFDFIIIHESGHEWFGNSVTAADRSDMWIHEGWTTYLETLFVEYHYGRADAIKYVNGLSARVRNRVPILGERGVNADPPQDQYFKGALMIHTLRSIVDDDPRWFGLIHDFYQHFKYQNIMTEDVVAWWSAQLQRDLTPFFNQYLRHTAIPALELNFDEANHTVMYKWQADEPGFSMPVKVGDPQHWQAIFPTMHWQTMNTPLSREQFQVATDLFYITVSKT